MLIVHIDSGVVVQTDQFGAYKQREQSDRQHPKALLQALRLFDPIHQRDGHADQPDAQQRIHAYFLAVAHRHGQQGQ
jgi:hypothetical protein